jgi:hypothetical protein
MQTCTFMPFWNIWQAMGGFDTKFFINLHFLGSKLVKLGGILGLSNEYVYSTRKRLTGIFNSVECVALSGGG